MKCQRILFLIILLFFCFYTVFGQGVLFRTGGKNKVPNQYKYGFYVRNKKGVIQPQKKDVIAFIQHTKLDTAMYVSENGKIISFFPIEDSSNTNDLQSIQGSFKVVYAEVKKDNYYVRGNHLKKTKLYVYDVEQVGSEKTSFKYIRILIFQHEFGNNLKKLKLGHNYNLTLTPFLQMDCCSPNPIVRDGDTIYRTRQSRGLYTYIIKGVLVPFFNFHDYNIVEITWISQEDKKRPKKTNGEIN